MPDATVYTRLESLLSAESRLLRDEPMARHTTLRVGGPADCFVEPSSEQDVSRLVRFCSEQGLPFVLIGRGSNLLVKDGGIRGVVISLCQAAFSRLEIAPPLLIAGAGIRLKTLAVEARRHGLADLEFLEGIPGCLGGALCMNAGAMGSSVFQVTKRVRFMDHLGKIAEKDSDDIAVTYRACPFLKGTIVLGAVLQGKPDSPEAIGRRMDEFSKKRWSSQPAAPTAGCMFKNPASIPAGRLVEELGLKGTRIGGAMISDVHGNFIVNNGQASASDILHLMQLIQTRARAERGIHLENEVQILGDDVS